MRSMIFTFLCCAQCGVYIAHDPALRAGKGGEAALARNSDIVEDLGLVRYVFSDKTGTLTANEMQLRGVAVRGATFGGGDVRCASQIPEILSRLSTLRQFSGCMGVHDF